MHNYTLILSSVHLSIIFFKYCLNFLEIQENHASHGSGYNILRLCCTIISHFYSHD